jgi:hypothetical protein
VVAHGNLRMRGQAFVSFESKESAAKAMKDIQRFPLYSKPMVCYFGISSFADSLNHDTSKYHSPRLGRTLW